MVNKIDYLWQFRKQVPTVSKIDYTPPNRNNNVETANYTANDNRNRRDALYSNAAKKNDVNNFMHYMGGAISLHHVGQVGREQIQQQIQNNLAHQARIHQLKSGVNPNYHQEVEKTDKSVFEKVKALYLKIVAAIKNISITKETVSQMQEVFSILLNSGYNLEVREISVIQENVKVINSMISRELIKNAQDNKDGSVLNLLIDTNSNIEYLVNSLAHNASLPLRDRKARQEGIKVNAEKNIMNPKSVFKQFINNEKELEIKLKSDPAFEQAMKRREDYIEQASIKRKDLFSKFLQLQNEVSRKLRQSQYDEVLDEFVAKQDVVEVAWEKYNGVITALTPELARLQLEYSSLDAEFKTAYEKQIQDLYRNGRNKEIAQLNDDAVAEIARLTKEKKEIVAALKKEKDEKMAFAQKRIETLSDSLAKEMAKLAPPKGSPVGSPVPPKSPTKPSGKATTSSTASNLELYKKQLEEAEQPKYIQKRYDEDIAQRVAAYKQTQKDIEKDLAQRTEEIKQAYTEKFEEIKQQMNKLKAEKARDYEAEIAKLKQEIKEVTDYYTATTDEYERYINGLAKYFRAENDVEVERILTEDLITMKKMRERLKKDPSLTAKYPVVKAKPVAAVAPKPAVAAVAPKPAVAAVAPKPAVAVAVVAPKPAVAVGAPKPAIAVAPPADGVAETKDDDKPKGKPKPKKQDPPKYSNIGKDATTSKYYHIDNGKKYPITALKDAIKSEGLEQEAIKAFGVTSFSGISNTSGNATILFNILRAKNLI